ncbi:Crp/Fnr family transcriptional regulator [Oscillatoria sp. FACHB-1406]|nr:Crp/Fnr family transcriptional regulator [Oscillatoria sp. FACHB-1406]MBD2580037.1 Crp/Fnr family transcriptional regulator [Oscillatoria sp. FACHB-1406]
MFLTPQTLPEFSTDDSQNGQRLHFYPKGEMIPLMTQGVWQVYRGLVQLSTTHSSGEEVLLGWAQPATFFGHWLTYLEVYEARALSDVYLRWYFSSEVENSARLCHLMFVNLSRRLKQTEAMLSIAGQRRVEDRLNQLLLLLQSELGEASAAGTRIGVRLTHQNLANAIGTTRVTITRLLGKLQRENYIFIDDDRHIVINDSKFRDRALAMDNG